MANMIEDFLGCVVIFAIVVAVMVLS